METACFCSKLGRSNFKRKITFLIVETIFDFNLPEEAVFPNTGNVFFNECFIPGSGNGFSG